MGILTHRIVFTIAFGFLFLAGTRAFGQEEEQSLPRVAAYAELEGGATVFQVSSMRSDFPVGLQLDFGVDLATGRDLRIRMRPQLGVRFFSRDIGRNIAEQFRFFRAGGTFSYDAYFLGQASFFPFVSLNYNWVDNYDAETVGHDSEGRPNIVHSDSFIKGHGVSTAFGLKVQYQRFFVRGGFEVFTPVLRVRYDEEIELPDNGGTVLETYYQREPFKLNTFNLSIGYILF